MPTFRELLELERTERYWDHKVYNVPVWYYVRERYTTSTRPVPTRRFRINIQSCFSSLAFLIRNRKRTFSQIHCFVDRNDLIDFYVFSRGHLSNDTLLILNRESGADIPYSYLTSDLFDVLRYVCRVFGWIFKWRLYQSTVSCFRSDMISFGDIQKSTRNAIGDSIYNILLSKILPKSSVLYYSGAVIPISEKFLNILSSCEIQHGVIHRNHPGYIGVPAVRNKLILYGERYQQLLKECRYEGEITVVRFKAAHQPNSIASPRYKVVIYTQPILELSNAINQLIKRIPFPVHIKIHPRDSYCYDKKAIVLNEVHPMQVLMPILYCSSVIEDYLVHGRSVYLLSLNLSDFDIKSYIDIYSQGNEKLINYCTIDEIISKAVVQ